MADDPAKILKDRLRADLKLAMKARDAAQASVLRSLLGAIDNSEAPDLDAEQAKEKFRRFGEGTAEVARRTLTQEELDQLLAEEVEARESAAAEFDRHGQSARAEALRAEAAIVGRYLG
jgi:uncharacterized protein YqeY